MYRINQMKGRRGGTTRNLGLLASIVLIAACSSEATKHPSENVGDAQNSLLAATCTVDTVAKTVAFAVAAGEVAYVGKVAGCTVEPCVFVNAIDAGGKICRYDTTAYTVAVTPSGAVGTTQKLVLDYTNGLFGLATSATPAVVSTLRSGSTVMVIAPTTGANMALGDKAGVHGLDLNTAVATRATAFVDVTMADGTKFMFNGGAGKDVFTADPAGWTTAPTGWDTAAHLTTAVGTASTLAVTASGGANDDTLAGGAGYNWLLGGPGNDTFLQGAGLTPRAEVMVGGDGIDTVDYSIRTAALAVSIDVESGVIGAAKLHSVGLGYAGADLLSVTGGDGAARIVVDTVDGAGRILTYHVSVAGTTYAPSPAAGTATVDTTASATGVGATFDLLVGNDGEAGEFDTVSADIEIVKGGSGDDVLTVHSTITTDVVLIGNAGNDKLTGGGGNDDLCGGAGDDTFYSNAGNDNLVGGVGNDTADYSASATAVVACLNVADTLAGKTCATQNGGTGEKDVVNGVLAKVCPRATLNIAVGITTAVTAVPTTSQGGAMTVDVENLTGKAAVGNTLACGTLPCTLFGSSASDTLAGGAAQDLIIGMGGLDTVTTNGGNDVVDLTHAGIGVGAQVVDCAGNQVTLLISAVDTLAGTACTNANTP